MRSADVPSRRRDPQPFPGALPLRAHLVVTLLMASVVVVGLWADGRRLDSAIDPGWRTGAEAAAGGDLAGIMAIQANGLHGDAVGIAFVPQWFAASKAVAYQYRLEGVDPDWRTLTDVRSLNYGRIAPGSYALAIRAIDADGAVSPRVATVAFRVAPPFWRRAWFLLTAAMALIATAYVAYRRRTLRLVELANMRTRIATDLHDDIGANLVRVAVLSEVVRRQAMSATASAQLAAIARIARESVSGMSDIVWAIDPERDRLVDLVRKMRAHAEETATGEGLALRFDVGDAGMAPAIAMDLRRDVFLIFKEAVNNAARHSRGRQLSITLRTSRRDLELEIADDGVGFEAERPSEGNGLGNMQRRAQRIGAALSVISSPGRGTRVRLTIFDYLRR